MWPAVGPARATQGARPLPPLKAVPTLAPVPERQSGPGSEQARLVFSSGEIPGAGCPNPKLPEHPAGRASPTEARLEEGSDSGLRLCRLLARSWGLGTDLWASILSCETVTIAREHHAGPGAGAVWASCPAAAGRAGPGATLLGRTLCSVLGFWPASPALLGPAMLSAPCARFEARQPLSGASSLVVSVQERTDPLRRPALKIRVLPKSDSQ